MAWQDTLQDAAFRGVPFQCERIGRGVQRAIARHEFPYAAGAELEDLNLSAREVRVRAVFFGDDYEDRLADFIGALEAPGTAELVHPVWGAMTVLAESWEDEHEAEFVDGASVVVRFIEDNLRELVFDAQSSASRTDAMADGAERARGVADDALDRYLGGVALEAPRVSVLEGAFSQVQGFFSGAFNLADSLGLGLVLSGLDALRHPRAFAADLLATVDAGFAALPFGGRNRGYTGAALAATTATAMLADFDRVASRLAPAALVLAPNVAAPSAAMLADVAVLQAHARVHCAAAVAEAAAIVLASEADTPLLQRKQIEQLTGRTRAAVQLAIDGARAALDAEARGQASAVLATLAWQVQEAARAVINQRPPLVQRASPVSGPVRLVAHALYGTPDRAPEISALNQLGRRVLVDRGERLNAYAR